MTGGSSLSLDLWRSVLHNLACRHPLSSLSSRRPNWTDVPAGYDRCSATFLCWLWKLGDSSFCGFTGLGCPTIPIQGCCRTWWAVYRFLGSTTSKFLTRSLAAMGGGEIGKKVMNEGGSEVFLPKHEVGTHTSTGSRGANKLSLSRATWQKTEKPQTCPSHS